MNHPRFFVPLLLILLNSPAMAQTGTGSPLPLTLSATAREIYDDNINQQNSQQGQFKTLLSPSLFYKYGDAQTSMSTAYTFTDTYYPDRETSQHDLAHSFSLGLDHSFSSRFSINLKENFRYGQEPELFASNTQTRRQGDYFGNQFATQLNAEWTPLFATTTNLSNDYLEYKDKIIAISQNYNSYSLGQDFKYVYTPILTFVVGGQVSQSDYFKATVGNDKSSRVYGGNAGFDLEILPSLTSSVRGGYQIVNNLNALSTQSGESSNPYGSFGLTWKSGAKSSLDLNYSHSSEQSDIVQAFTTESDSVTFGINFQLTPSLRLRTSVRYSMNSYGSSNTYAAGNVPDERILATNLLLSYQINKYLSLELTHDFTDLSSDNRNRAYSRNQVGLGIRAEY